jgi:hypothetical protein
MAKEKPGPQNTPGGGRPAPVSQPKQRTCGTMGVHHRLLSTVPGYREARDNIENHAWRSALSPLSGRSGCTKIPVVVHVVYKTAAQNISDAQIHSQIDVLNADYRKKNGDASSVPGPFQPFAADTRIQFELATKDPQGQATNGITRTQTAADSFSDDDKVKSAATGGADAWPHDKYLNIWVCQLGGGLLGYAQFPGGPANTDGVVILHSAFGTTGTAAAPFNLGRSATHEVGHWLNLRHIWGDDGNGCSGSDFVADTPNQAGPNFGKPAFPSVTCSNGPNGDMFMNYMDYVDDDAMFMFTAGQVTRMQAALDGPRSSIGTSIPCGKTIIKEHAKDPVKDLPKDLPKDGVKELPKDPPKDVPKDAGKDLPKDIPKDIPKDLPKDPPKDNPKEFHKDFPKDPPKELIFEGNKNLVNDLPPKSISDPPKAFLEPPGDLGGIVTNPVQPVNPGFFGGGATPFVLGTPVTTPMGRTGGCGCKEAAAAGQQQGAILLPLLAQYARLHAMGMLDPAGVMAWQQCAAVYRQVTGGGQGY